MLSSIVSAALNATRTLPAGQHAILDWGLYREAGGHGIELHPANGVIYACSTAGHLLAVDPNGQVTDIGDMGQGGSCTNLAAPWLEVPCLDGI